MAKSFSGDVGAFLATTTIFDEAQVRGLDVQSNEFKDFLVDLLQTVNNIALVTNVKESAYYYEQEFVTSGAYFPNPALNSSTAQTPITRQVVRKTINFGALPNGSKSVPHGISIADPKSAVRIYGAATTPSMSWIPIPFASPTLSENIKVEINATHIVITTGSNRASYTKCYIVIEYITS